VSASRCRSVAKERGLNSGASLLWRAECHGFAEAKALFLKFRWDRRPDIESKTTSVHQIVLINWLFYFKKIRLYLIIKRKKSILTIQLLQFGFHRRTPKPKIFGHVIIKNVQNLTIRLF
jgi:hypothetical protein